MSYVNWVFEDRDPVGAQGGHKSLREIARAHGIGHMTVARICAS